MRFRLPLIILVIASCGTAFGFLAHRQHALSLPLREFHQPTSFVELVNFSPPDLEKVDLGLMNLLCAEGLPGCEDMNVKFELAILNDWTENIRKQTERNLYRYQREPEKFHNMEGYFRMALLITILMQDFHVHYDMSLDSSPDNLMPAEQFYANCKSIFIHGLLADGNTGTCASMPVLYATIARRLGYPVKLVGTKSHLFARWEDATCRFNIEGTNHGMSSHPDEYYTKGEFTPRSETESKERHYLQSQSAAEDLADFLATRGIALQVHGKYVEAKLNFERAHELDPSNDFYLKLTKQKAVTKTEAIQ